MDFHVKKCFFDFIKISHGFQVLSELAISNGHYTRRHTHVRTCVVVHCK